LHILQKYAFSVLLSRFSLATCSISPLTNLVEIGIFNKAYWIIKEQYSIMLSQVTVNNKKYI
jgi:hypothetical protein